MRADLAMRSSRRHRAAASVTGTGAASQRLPHIAPMHIVGTMSAFVVNVTARNSERKDLSTPPIEVLVDTGSELTWLPEDVLAAAGISRLRKRTFATATSQVVSRDVGYAI